MDRQLPNRNTRSERAVTVRPQPPETAQLEGCWNQIGVYGDGSCPELTRQVHCRNCGVYARAGRRLLDRAIPADLRREWTAHYARPKRQIAACDTSGILFRLGTEWYALDTTLLQEIAEARPMHTLPHRQQGVLIGLVNVRGELLLLVALSRLLQSGGADSETAGQYVRGTSLCQRLFVGNADFNRFAFPVDEVQGIHQFNRAELTAPPLTATPASRTFTRGLFRCSRGGYTVSYLDAAALIYQLNRSLA